MQLLTNYNILKSGLLPTFILSLIILLTASCSRYFERAEARDDARKYAKAELAQAQIPYQCYAKVETNPVLAEIDADSADDPAIWIHPEDSSKNIIFGSNKKAGIHAYDLKGRETQFVPCGKINNIDIRQGVKWGNGKADILAGSNRTDNSISIFVVNKNGHIANEVDYSVNLGIAFEPYGFCLYKGENEQLYAFVNNKDGKVFQIYIDIDAEHILVAKTVRTLQVASQVEGMVVDDNTHTFYLGEEELGIHIFDAKEDGATKGELLSGSTKRNPNIRYDIEGIAFLPPHYLVASSQGNFTYALFDTKKKTYLTSFYIAKKDIDGVQETDGLEIMTTDMGSQFPEGILVVQDGFNFDGETKRSQNFKYVDIRDVKAIIEKMEK